jgi:glutamate-1-semialdehyde 2,1-aminomutase
MSHGASLLGHNHPAIKAAVAKALDLGVVCSYETEHHVALARRVTELVPCAELVRFAGSGTETVMHALRLARSFTGRDRVIKFEGHFHGYCDALNFSAAPPLDQAGPARAPRTYPETSGIPASAYRDIVIIPFNDEQALEEAFVAHGQEAAALLVEPINYDQGCILPKPGFLQRCRELCDKYGVVLLFDEVLTAFRVALGGAQQLLGVTPDLCVLGKAFGGGMPISAVAGRREIMRHLRPVGRSEMSGTYLAHLTAVLGAMAALEEYSNPGFYDRLGAVGRYFFARFHEIIERSGVPVRLQYLGPRFGLYFGIRDEVTDYRQAACKNAALEHAFIAECYRRGVYFAVSPHHGFSAAHSQGDMDCVLAAIAGAMEEVKQIWRAG